VTTESMLPAQAAPIDRTPAGAAAFANNAGVEASGWLDIVKTVGGSLLQGI
jgi:hypothetical protein